MLENAFNSKHLKGRGRPVGKSDPTLAYRVCETLSQ